MATSRSKTTTKKSGSFEETFWKDEDPLKDIPIIAVTDSVPSDQDIISIATALHLIISEDRVSNTSRPWSQQHNNRELL